MALNPLEWVSRQHPEFPYVTEKTKVVLVGAAVLAVTHQCKTGGVAGFVVPKQQKSAMLPMFAPSLGANRTAYCRACDTLYVGEEANRHGG